MFSTPRPIQANLLTNPNLSPLCPWPSVSSQTHLSFASFQTPLRTASDGKPTLVDLSPKEQSCHLFWFPGLSAESTRCSLAPFSRVCCMGMAVCHTVSFKADLLMPMAISVTAWSQNGGTAAASSLWKCSAGPSHTFMPSPSDQLHSTSGDWPLPRQELPNAGTQASSPSLSLNSCPGGDLMKEPLE